MTADACGNGRRNDGHTFTSAPNGSEQRPVVRDFQATCPNCGRQMTRDNRNERHLTCSSCGNHQHIDVLGPTASARQADALHDRGLDRLLNTIAR